MNRLLNYFNRLRLGHKLILVFAVVSIFPILFMQIFFFRVNRDQMLDNIDQVMETNLSQIAEQVDLSLQMYSSQVYQIYRDEQIIENVTVFSDDTDTHKAVAYNNIVKQLKKYNVSGQGVRCICIVCPDGNAIVYDFQNDSSLKTIWNSYHNMLQVPPYRNALEEPGMVVTDTMTFKNGEETGHYFHISKRMFDFDDLESGSIGTVIMTVEESALNSRCNTASDDLEGKSAGVNFIVNDERRVIAYPDEDFSGIVMNPELSMEEFVKVSGYLRGSNAAISTWRDDVTGWTFCNAHDVDEMLRSINRLGNTQFLLTGITLLFATAVILYIVRTLDRSVGSVVSGMQEAAKGNLDVVVPVQSFYEIGTIADGFNEMTVKVKELIREVGDAKERQKDAEIKALEAQINPHFLYNTLDSINWIAIEKEEYEISKMLRDLGVILRYSISRSNETVSIWEMTDWLEKYVGLQQVRFENVFSCEIHVEEELYPLRIRKLLLQPFVENTIIHGFRGITGGGLLRIEGHLGESRKEVIFIIEDNGHGISKELAAAFNNVEEAVRDDGRSIGLHNAFARMKMYYGDGASWNISSIEGMGTVITLRLPAVSEEALMEESYENRDRGR